MLNAETCNPERMKKIVKQHIIDLSGTWSLTDSQDHNLTARLPGDNYNALFNAAMIPDPYYGENEDHVQWPRDRIWTFSRVFEINGDFLNDDFIFLNLDSVDTIAEIYLNDRFVGSSRNMFMRFRSEVKEWLVEGVNKLTVVIQPPGPYALKLAEKLPFPLRWCSHNQLPYMNLIRKAQCHTGWDWGICLPVCGIYGKMYLQGVDHCRIEHVYTEQIHSDGICKVKVFAELTGNCADICFELNGEVHKVSASGQAETEFIIENPKLWYPLGQGEQPLYTLHVYTDTTEVIKKIGLRQVELVREPDVDGCSMYFRINGVPVFAKGANWIPMDAMPGRMNSSAYRLLLSDAAAVHMNMLRVWGGGFYEDESFYDICDELGIMVWQDCMFSCAEYPSDPEFSENITGEIEYQVKRLRDHACIVLWCGDNEIAAPLSGENPQFCRTLANYDRFNQIVEKAVYSADPTRMFWPSSPCNGPLDCYSVWRDENKGDLHYWDVWHAGKPFEEYFNVRPRFCSEFGFQSFPDISTVRRYGGCNVTDPVMEKHQKNQIGNSKIIEMFSRYFRFPNGLENFVYLSQVQQAVAIRMAVEYWRSLKPYCMGTLYWQFNDNWPVASWSSIDYYGNWKLLHYAAKRFFAPLLVTAKQNENNELEFFAVNDSRANRTVTVHAELISFSGDILEKREYSMQVDPAGSVCIGKWAIPASDHYFVHYEWENNSGDFFFVPFKRCMLQKAEIQFRKVLNGYELTTDVPAFFVTLESKGVIWSDNGVTLLPNRPIVLQIVRGHFSVEPVISQLATVDTLNRIRCSDNSNT